MIYEQKILSKYFEAVLIYNEPFELRKNDRNFQVGDQVILKEYSEENGYTGRNVRCDIVCIMTDTEYVKTAGDTVYVIRTRKIKGHKVEYKIAEEMVDCFRIGDSGKFMADICLNNSGDWLTACDESEYYIIYEQAINHLKKEIETKYIRKDEKK